MSSTNYFILFPSSCFLFVIAGFITFVLMCASVYMSRHTYVGQRLLWKNYPFLQLWKPGIELRSSDLAASTCTHWAIYQSCAVVLIHISQSSRKPREIAYSWHILQWEPHHTLPLPLGLLKGKVPPRSRSSLCMCDRACWFPRQDPSTHLWSVWAVSGDQEASHLGTVESFGL